MTGRDAFASWQSYGKLPYQTRDSPLRISKLISTPVFHDFHLTIPLQTYVQYLQGQVILQ